MHEWVWLIKLIQCFIVQLVDTTATGQMNFNSFCQLFGIMSRSTLQERLKLLFILHLKELTECEEEEEHGIKIDYNKLSAGHDTGETQSASSIFREEGRDLIWSMNHVKNLSAC